MEESSVNHNEVIKKSNKLKQVLKDWQLYVLIFPGIIYFLVFKYYPMYGLQIAFKNFRGADGILGSEWVGLSHFQRFFESYYFWEIIWNTLSINVYQLLLFPTSVIVAIVLNEIKNKKFKKVSQTITYAPHFISVVVMVGMIITFLNPLTGMVNLFLGFMGIEPISFMTEPGWFKTVYVFSGEWQQLGWGAIIYLAALAGIDPQLHEAAMVDGATRLQRIRHIDLPGILPTIVILLILNMGSFMSVGFEKILLMQNDLNISASQVIQTHVYKAGLLDGQFSYAAAVGLFNSVINFIILVIFNRLARKTGTSLW